MFTVSRRRFSDGRLTFLQVATAAMLLVRREVCCLMENFSRSGRRVARRRTWCWVNVSSCTCTDPDRPGPAPNFSPISFCKPALNADNLRIYQIIKNNKQPSLNPKPIVKFCTYLSSTLMNSSSLS